MSFRSSGTIELDRAAEGARSASVRMSFRSSGTIELDRAAEGAR